MTSGHANGEGTLYRRKDGRWEGAAYVPTASGKRKRIRIYGKTKDEARAKLTARLSDADRNIPVSDVG
ncbi:hypothetical protein EV580_6627 [Mycobacterium sp. BK086]|uniref:hypothetical protein n=1 Tax=Mycobacterium sp. BK086 TaxID=2512165 RepID=UPI00105E8421|nr:hypothetical protein [Mycobacterium sp. BK086]TDO06531.1 hypothetical protein EV580_6627 [Mycobacterium sp. BK086]